MSPLAQQIIDALTQEEDANLLAEVLDFYEYLKAKKIRQNNAKWKTIKEESPTDEEAELIDGYIKNKGNIETTISLNSLVEELGISE